MTTPTSPHAALAAHVAGRVHLPGDDGYDTARSGFQAAFAHAPGAVVAAAGPGDVRTAVAHAAEHGLPVAVQATGHGLATPLDGGVLVTTGAMAGVAVDPAARTARVGAGTRWADVVAAAARYGLAPLSGSSPTVGAVGYTLGGGLGLLARTHGYAADHVRALEVVTADARPRRVTAADDPDLFWALRGGPLRLAAVTAMEIGLVPVERVYGGELVFTEHHLDALLPAYLEWAATAPEEVTTSLGLLRYPAIPQLPEEVRGRYLVHLRVTATTDAEQGARLLAPLRALGPVRDTVADLAFADSERIYADPAEPHGYDADNSLLTTLDAGRLRAVLEEAGPSAPLMCVVGLRHLGGALARPAEHGAAVGHRGAAWLLQVLSPVEGPDPAAVRGLHGRALAPVRDAAVGRAPNFLFGDHPADADRPWSTPGDARRLARVKADRDPDDLFRSAAAWRGAATGG
jgi:FAD/FMN-containing dehydrogenase